ncbi:hypothetical protein ILT44_11725 [Microvirga sp. BT689]|uniref:hypothetical protein n=1 Tax=Microvirga arvi TaxID=2778731 RepID=UPI0019508439|nr:hypothetical protein [Microvirga arvi]MBM6580854.1 hypothetical protein [Microvirga arvi]
MSRERPKLFQTGLRATLLRSIGLLEVDRPPTAVKLSLLVASVITLTVGATITAFVYMTHTQRSLLALRLETREIRTVQLALLDIETGAGLRSVLTAGIPSTL